MRMGGYNGQSNTRKWKRNSETWLLGGRVAGSNLETPLAILMETERCEKERDLPQLNRHLLLVEIANILKISTLADCSQKFQLYAFRSFAVISVQSRNIYDLHTSPHLSAPIHKRRKNNERKTKLRDGYFWNAEILKRITARVGSHV